MKEFLSQNKIDFTERNIAADESALAQLEKLGHMTTPVAVIDGEVVVGFDVPKLQALLRRQFTFIGATARKRTKHDQKI